MRSTTLPILALVALGAGCEHKNKTDKHDTTTPTTPGSGTVAKDMTTPPPPPENPGSAAVAPKEPEAPSVRPPVAADLAEYTKDLPGSGNKLLAKFETSMGTINCELFPEKAPMTVANF